jgi:hypothetical protein
MLLRPTGLRTLVIPGRATWREPGIQGYGDKIPGSCCAGPGMTETIVRVKTLAGMSAHLWRDRRMRRARPLARLIQIKAKSARTLFAPPALPPDEIP